MARDSVVLVLTVVLLAGCSGKESAEARVKAMYKDKLKEVVPVSGNVTVDGEPAGNVILYLHPSNGGASINTAITNEDGSYCWTTYVSCDGLEPGDYRISFKRFKNPRKEKGDDQLNGRFSNPMTIKYELKVTADEPETTADYELKTK